MLLSRAVIDALLPGGSLWSVEDDADLDNLLDGIAANNESVLEWLQSLARLRNPMLTSSLDDLEREFGIVPDNGITEGVRRTRLQAVKTAVNSNGSVAFMQTQLHAAGFNVQVHVNHPPIDPALILSNDNAFIFGNTDVQFGQEAMVFGTSGQADLIVNGQPHNDYSLPPESYWSLIFFVGGDLYRNDLGEIVAIDPAPVNILRRNELETLILKLKPLHAWCGPLLKYVVGDPMAPIDYILATEDLSPITDENSDYIIVNTEE